MLWVERLSSGVELLSSGVECLSSEIDLLYKFAISRQQRLADFQTTTSFSLPRPKLHANLRIHPTFHDQRGQNL